MLVKANGKEYVVKFKYASELITKTKIDKYRRKITVEWMEKLTVCTIKIIGGSTALVSGISRCNYRDNFEKSHGREYAFVRAVDFISDNNQEMFNTFIEQYNSVFKKKILRSENEDYIKSILKIK